MKTAIKQQKSVKTVLGQFEAWAEAMRLQVVGFNSVSYRKSFSTFATEK